MRRATLLAVTLALVAGGGSPAARAGDLAGGKAALVLYDDAASRALAEELSRLLRQRYGFDEEITRVLGPQVRRGDLAIALGELDSRLRGREATDLLVLVALRSEALGRDTFVRLADAEPDAPWSWPRVASLLQRAEEMNTRGVLFITPSCAASEEAVTSGSLQYRPPTRGSLSVISYCDAPGGSPHAMRVALLKALADVLSEPAERGGRALDPGGLTEALVRRLPPLSVSLQQAPDVQDRRFAFVAAQSDVATYAARLRGASDDGERSALLQSLLLVANGDPQALGGSASAVCEELALDEALSLDARRSATGALARIQHASAGAGLARISRTPQAHQEIRIEALAHLSRRGDREAIARLQEDPDERVRTAAIRFGTGVLGPEAADAWLKGLASPDPGVKLAAVRGLSSLKRAEDRPRFQEILEDGSNDPRIRTEAVDALGRTGIEAPYDAVLLRSLGDAERLVRRASAFALARSRSTPEVAKRIEESLVERLADDEASVQEGAAFALGERRSEAAREALEAALSSPKRDEAVQIAAAEALGKIAHPDSVPTLAEVAEDGPPRLRLACTAALGRVASAAAATALLDRLADSDPYVSEQAMRSVAEIKVFNRRDVLQRVDARSPKVRAGAVELLGRSEAPADTETILRRLHDEDPGVRAAAIDVIARRKQDSVVASLGALLDGPSPNAREAAAAALSRMKTPAARDALIQRAGAEGSPAHAEAVRALDATDAKSREAVQKAFGSPDPEVKAAAIDVLAVEQKQKWDPEITKQLREATAPGNPAAVRERALEALAAESAPIYRMPVESKRGP